jgi:hypothetical protein
MTEGPAESLAVHTLAFPSYVVANLALGSHLAGDAAAFLDERREVA